MNTRQMTLLPVFRKNLLLRRVRAVPVSCLTSVPLLFAYNRLKIAFHIQICIFVAVSYDFLVEEIVSARFQDTQGTPYRLNYVVSVIFLQFSQRTNPELSLRFTAYQFVANLRHPLAGGIHIVNHTHRFGLFGDLLRKFLSLCLDRIREYFRSRIQYALVAAYFLPRADALGNFPALFLRQASP